MVEVSISDAQERFSSLIERAGNGERIVITDAGVRLVELRPFHQRQHSSRVGGIWRGRVQISEDFDEPLFDMEREIYGDCD